MNCRLLKTCLLTLSLTTFIYAQGNKKITALTKRVEVVEGKIEKLEKINKIVENEGFEKVLNFYETFFNKESISTNSSFYELVKEMRAKTGIRIDIVEGYPMEKINKQMKEIAIPCIMGIYNIQQVKTNGKSNLLNKKFLFDHKIDSYKHDDEYYYDDVFIVNAWPKFVNAQACVDYFSVHMM